MSDDVVVGSNSLEAYKQYISKFAGKSFPYYGGEFDVSEVATEAMIEIVEYIYHRQHILPSNVIPAEELAMNYNNVVIEVVDKSEIYVFNIVGNCILDPATEGVTLHRIHELVVIHRMDTI